MNTQERTTLLRLALLRELDSCGTRAVPQAAVCNAMYGQVSPVPTKAEILSALDYLQQEDYVVAVQGLLGSAPAHMITTNGRAAIHA